MRYLATALTLFAVLALTSPDASAGGNPVTIECTSGTSCRADYDIAPSGTKKFRGKCTTEREVECGALLNPTKTTVPFSQVCKDNGSKNVTCTATNKAACSSTYALCSCTNWSPMARNGAHATVNC